MRLLLLLIALQVAGQDAAQRARELRRLEELRDSSSMMRAQERDRKYKAWLLNQRHYEFVQAFNEYLEKYLQGLSATKELSKAMKAFERLKNTEGFDYARDNPSKTKK